MHLNKRKKNICFLFGPHLLIFTSTKLSESYGRVHHLIDEMATFVTQWQECNGATFENERKLLYGRGPLHDMVLLGLPQVASNELQNAT